MATISTGAKRETTALVEVPPGRNFVSLSILESYSDWKEGASGPGYTDKPTTCQQNSGTISIPELNYNQGFSQSVGAPAAWTKYEGSAECVGGDCAACNLSYNFALVLCLSLRGDEAVACQTRASDNLLVCLAAAAGDYDTRQYNSRQYWQVLPLIDSVTQNGTTLTLNASSAGGTGSYYARAILSGDVGFRLTQTDRFFRPRDARDPAAQCEQAGNQNNCYTPFTLSFDPPDPMGSGATGVDWFGSCTLRLEIPPYQQNWLPGSSTNYTLPNTDPNAPDYVFEKEKNKGSDDAPLMAPSSDGLSISTGRFDFNGPVSPWSVTVTSNDYGGQANLRATCTIDNIATPLEATIMDAGTGQYIRPQSSCGKDSSGKDKRANGNYATIPVDEDCNGIADSWEGQFVGAYNAIMQRCNPGWVPISAFNGSEDSEPVVNDVGTPDCSKLFGDGLTVADEYRGFHTLVQASKGQPWNRTWASTDPVSGVDAFYMVDETWEGGKWPDAPANHYFPVVPGRPVVESVSEVLIPAIPTVAFHLVEEGYAGARDPDAFSRQRLNKNSTGTNEAFVIEFNNANVQVRNTSPGTNGDILGASHENDGRYPIDLYPTEIAQYSAREAFPVKVMQDQVVAHEVGHKLQMLHPWYDSTKADYDAAQIASLSGKTQYMVDPKLTNTIYIALNDYGFTRPAPVEGGPKQYTWDERADGFDFNPVLEAVHEGASKAARWDEDVINVYRVTLASPPSQLAMAVLTGQGTIMDWTLRLTYQDIGKWKFDQIQLNSTCVLSVFCFYLLPSN